MCCEWLNSYFYPEDFVYQDEFEHFAYQEEVKPEPVVVAIDTSKLDDFDDFVLISDDEL